jgi:hypothetical protein
MKSLASISLDIKGRSWNFILYPDRTYNKLHNSEEGSDSCAMTLQGTREVHFRKSDFNGIAILHEIGHILHFASLVSSSEMSAHDTVELMCEIIGEHAEEMVMWKAKVLDRFLSV